MIECEMGCDSSNESVSCDGKEHVCASNNIEFKWFECTDAMNAFNCEKHKGNIIQFQK